MDIDIPFLLRNLHNIYPQYQGLQIEYLKKQGHKRSIEFIPTNEENYSQKGILYLCCSSGNEMGTMDGIYNYFWGMNNNFVDIGFRICGNRIRDDLEQLEILCLVMKGNILYE